MNNHHSLSESLPEPTQQRAYPSPTQEGTATKSGSDTPLVEHIASFVVQCHPDRQQTILQKIETTPGTEVPLQDPTGKLVVLFSTSSTQAINDFVADISRMDGVLSVSLVYHHHESFESLNEAIEK